MRKSLIDTELYCITGEDLAKGRSNIFIVSEIIDAGIKMIQYREKSKSKLYKYKDCIKIREMTKTAKASFLLMMMLI